MHFSYLAIFFKGKDLEFNESKYLTLEFINNEGRFTNLALLFSDENPIEIKFDKYDSKIDFLFKREYKGPLCLIADQILRKAEEFNILSAKILPYQAAREEKISFPRKSLREAIINAVCHADYEFPSNIKIEFFPNYCSVSNPGPIYKYTLKEALKGKQSFRNPGVVRILHVLGFIENYGTGLKRIVDSYSKSKLKPSFHNMDNSFTLELPNLNPNGDKNIDINEPVNGAGGADNGADNGAVKSLKNRLISELTKNPKSSRKELASKLNIGTTTVYRTIDKLKKDNKIRRVGSDKDGYWEIINKEED